MRRLLLDIESAPALGDVWTLWNTNVSLNQLRRSPFMMCWAAKWYREDPVMFSSYYHDSKEDMVVRAWELLNQADVMVGYNSQNFDAKKLNSEFQLMGLGPPSPYKHVDLYRVIKGKFNLVSYKLEYVLKYFGLPQKLQTGGHSLWTRCLNEEDDAWADFRSYNENDVLVLEPLYDKLLPWIDGHPNFNLYQDTEDNCTNCGSLDLIREGKAYTGTGIFQRYSCRSCGRWLRGVKRLSGTQITQEK